jgi:hypothetical protein
MVGLAASLALGGCITRDPYVTTAGETRSGEWRVATQPDRITGYPLPSARVTAMASNSYVDNPKPVVMQLTCFDGKPLVRFAFAFKIGSDANTSLGYRFDDKPGRDNISGARFLQEHRTVVIENKPDVLQFVADLRGSQSLYVRISSITQGRSTAEFKLDGSEAALDAAFAGCPLTPDPPPQAAMPRRRVS